MWLVSEKVVFNEIKSESIWGLKLNFAFFLLKNIEVKNFQLKSWNLSTNESSGKVSSQANPPTHFK